MATKKEDRKLTEKPSRVMAFLSGKGPNPLPEGKKGGAGPLEAAFIKGVEDDVRAQDEVNDARPELTALEELVAVLRLLSDNREMLSIIENGECSSVSELARQMNRELPNVSRTISKLAVYGIVGLIREGGAAKRPVLLVKLPKGTALSDWAESYCLVRAIAHGGLMGMEMNRLMAAEDAVTSVMEVAAKSFDQITARTGARSAKTIAG